MVFMLERVTISAAIFDVFAVPELLVFFSVCFLSFCVCLLLYLGWSQSDGFKEERGRI